jgi:TATA-binding protein-associated factor Taf7
VTVYSRAHCQGGDDCNDKKEEKAVREKKEEEEEAADEEEEEKEEEEEVMEVEDNTRPTEITRRRRVHSSKPALMKTRKCTLVPSALVLLFTRGRRAIAAAP